MKKIKYVAIPPGAIMPDILPEFEIFILSPDGTYILWAQEGNKVTYEQLAKLSEGGFREVYVNIDDKFKYERYLEANLGNILESSWSSDDHKTAIFSKVSTNVVKTAVESSLGLGTMGEEAMQQTIRMVKNALIFIMEANSIRALAKMIGHDYQTYEHATKVLWFTVAFLRNNLDILKKIQPSFETSDKNQMIEILGQCGVGALLHDIGKAFIPSEILNKTGPLTEVEWEIIKRHPFSGMAMLLDTDIPAFVKKAVLHHHEDFYGGGYPMGIAGQNISILARILRIIDTFEAMTSRRPYKAPIRPGEAVQIMVGRQQANIVESGRSQVDYRDLDMKRCFDGNLLRRFILFLGNYDLSK
ncbi:MAG: HD domain-containing phosphohydrolase [Syntrophales bacterium]|jgi:HD-GYP domain-containing protein (c-di-GMP phosphodiesterase class II)